MPDMLKTVFCILREGDDGRKHGLASRGRSGRCGIMRRTVKDHSAEVQRARKQVKSVAYIYLSR